MRQFDEHLADNVRETFDNWREGVPEWAWAGMKAKLDGASKPKVVRFLSTRTKVAVASVLAAASVALLLAPVFIPNKKVGSAKTSEVAEAHLPTSTNQGLPQSHPIPSVSQNAYQAPEPDTKLKSKKKPTMVQREPVIAVLQTELPTVPQQLVETGSIVNEQPKTAQAPEKGNANDPHQPQKEITTIEPTFAENVPTNVSGYLPWLPPSTPKNRLSWTLSASPMFSFTQNQPTPLPGFSAGVSAGYKLSQRVKLEVGGLLAYNQLDIRNQATRALQETFAGLFNIQSGTNPVHNFSGNNKYNFLALEIPANIQFSVFEDAGRRLFVSTGLTSLVYLHQSVSGVNYLQFRNSADGLPLGPESFYSLTIFVDDTFGPLSRVDLGRMLNLSAGYVIIGKKNSLILEPFLKLPLGDISSSNLRIGMGGMNLKFLFSGK